MKFNDTIRDTDIYRNSNDPNLTRQNTKKAVKASAQLIKGNLRNTNETFSFNGVAVNVSFV